jgi:hypothetical protein
MMEVGGSFLAKANRSGRLEVASDGGTQLVMPEATLIAGTRSGRPCHLLTVAP